MNAISMRLESWARHRWPKARDRFISEVVRKCVAELARRRKARKARRRRR